MNNRDKKNTKDKLIIWALYDDAESSTGKACHDFFKDEAIVYSIGINDLKWDKNSNWIYKKIDLSLNNINLLTQLKEIPLPDIIFASPPCESWSGADCGGRMIKSINKDGTWKVMNQTDYDNYNKTSHPVKRRYFINKEISRLIGESTIGATIHIIRTFNPKYWIIENPQTSKSWEFQENHWAFDGFKNLAYYSSYNSNFSKKPTIFKSNVKLNLKRHKVTDCNNNHIAKGSYKKRSSIPQELIQDILKQLISSKKARD